MTHMESALLALVESRLLVVQQELRPSFSGGQETGDRHQHAILCECFRLIKLMRGDGDEKDVKWLLNGRKET